MDYTEKKLNHMKKIKRFWVISGGILVFNLIMYLTHLGGDRVLLYVSDLLPVGYSLLATIFLYRTYREFKVFDFTKLAWMLIFIGIGLDFVAETTYSVFEIGSVVNVDEVFPTLADYIWCIAYLPVFAGLIIMYCGYKRSGLPMGKEKLYWIMTPLVLIGLSLVIIYLLIPIIRDAETERIAKIFYLFYPIADLMVVIPALILVYITSLFGRAMISWPWRFLAFGFICFTVSDLLYSYLDWLDKYGNGNLIDLGWNIGYLLIAISALYQQRLMASINGGE
jgi:hypothetical protein